MKHHSHEEHHGAPHGVKPGHREHRETGGVNEAEEDLREKPEARTNARKIDDSAEERKHGGEAKRKRERKLGGKVREHKVDHEGKLMRPKRKAGGMAEKKHVEMHGEEAKHHAGRKPRKSGGKTGADSHPFSSARKGTPAPGRKLEMEFE